MFALFDRRVNRIGSIAAFAVSLVLRLGGGEPLFGMAPTIPYPELFAAVLPGPAAAWYDPATGALLFPYKTLAALAGVVCLPVVSRLTARWDPPRRCGTPTRMPAPSMARRQVRGRDESRGSCLGCRTPTRRSALRAPPAWPS